MARQACEMRRVEKKDGKEGKGQKAHMILDCCMYVDDKVSQRTFHDPGVRDATS